MGADGAGENWNMKGWMKRVGRLPSTLCPRPHCPGPRGVDRQTTRHRQGMFEQAVATRKRYRIPCHPEFREIWVPRVNRVGIIINQCAKLSKLHAPFDL
jgi:hypothetical protein